MSECERARRLLALRPAECNQGERRLAEAHLQTCASCAAISRAHGEQDRLLERAASGLPVQLRWEPLLEQARRRQRGRRIGVRLRAVLSYAAATVAVIAMVGGLNALFRQFDGSRSAQPISSEGTVTAEGTATLRVQSTGVVTPSPIPTETSTPPSTSTSVPTPTPAPTETATPLPATHTPASPLPTAFGYGIQAEASADLDRVIKAVNDLGFGWLKQDVRWAQVEPARGEFDWVALDAIVQDCDAAGIRLMLSVIQAPAWSREGQAGVGPPVEAQDLADFAGTLAARYRGRVHAYEIWYGQNTKARWEGAPLSAEAYVRLLADAYAAIKDADPDAIVVSGALDPTGVDDGEWATNHLSYLQQMYQAGLREVCDVVGAHPAGYANPPDVYYEGGSLDPDRAYDDHPSFFFRNTMEDTYAVMEQNGDGDKRVWATEFGWATVDGLGVAPSPVYAFAADIDERQQADYIVGAYRWAREWGHAGTMFLWNLNLGPALGVEDAAAKYSIVYEDWSPRPAYAALKEMSK